MSEEIDLIAMVSREELGLPELNIHDNDAYTLARNFEIGTVTWRKEAASSPFVHGRYVVNEVKDAVESTVGVYVSGETPTQVTTRVGELVTAFTEQYAYTLRIIVDGQEHQWRCERADYDVGFMTEYLSALYVPVAFSVMRHPVALQGPI